MKLAYLKDYAVCFLLYFGLMLLSGQEVFSAATVKTDDVDGAVRNSLNNAFAKIFNNLYSFGKCSKACISYHTSMQNASLPFAIFAADYNGGFTMIPKISNPDGTAKVFTLADTGNKFLAINDLDFEIDDYGGDIVYKYAVSVQGLDVSVAGKQAFSKTGATLLDAATLKTVFPGADSLINGKLAVLMSSVAGVAEPNRVFTRTNKWLRPTNSSLISTPLDKTNWQPLSVNGVAVPVDVWVDYAPTQDADIFLKGRPVIFRGDLLVTDDTYSKYKGQRTFRVDQDALISNYGSISSYTTSLLRYLTLAPSSAQVTAGAFEIAFKSGQTAARGDSIIPALSGLRVKSISSYADGVVVLTDKGAYQFPITSVMDLFTRATLPEPMSLPNFAKYSRLEVAGTQDRIYFVARCDDTTFDIGRIDAKGAVQFFSVPVFVDSVSVDSAGHACVVDSQIHECWWTSIVDVFSGSSAFAPDAMKNFVAMKDAELAREEQSLAQAKNDIVTLKAQESLARTTLPTLAGDDYLKYLEYLGSILSLLSGRLNDAFYQSFLVCRDYFDRGIATAQALVDRNSVLQDVSSLVTRYQTDVAAYDKALNDIQTNEIAPLAVIPTTTTSTTTKPADNVLNMSPDIFTTKVSALQSKAMMYFNAKVSTLQSSNTLVSQSLRVNDEMAAFLTMMKKVRPDPLDAQVSSVSAQVQSTSTVLQPFVTTRDSSWDTAIRIPIMFDDLIAKVSAEITRLTTAVSASGLVDDVLAMYLNQLQGLYLKNIALLEAQGDLISILLSIYVDEIAAIKAKKLLTTDTAVQATLDTRISALNTKLADLSTQAQTNVSARQSTVQSLSKLGDTFSSKITFLSQTLATQKAALDKIQSNETLIRQNLVKTLDYTDPMFAQLQAVVTKSDSTINDVVNAMTDTINRQKALIVSLQAEKTKATQELTTLIAQAGGTIDASKSLFDQIQQYADLITKNAGDNATLLNQQLSDKTALATTLQTQADSIQTALNQAIASGNLTGLDPKAGLLEKLNFILAAKDKLISDLNQQISDQKKQIDSQAAQLATNQATIQTLQNAESAVRLQVQNALKNTGSTTLTAAQQSVAGSQTSSLADLLPILLSIVDAKEALIRQLQLDIAAKDQALQESTAQRITDAATTKTVEDSLAAKLAQYAAQTVDGSTMVMQFAAGSTLQQQLDQLMAFRQAQMTELTNKYETDKANMLSSLADLQTALNAEKAKTSGLTDLTNSQKTTIDSLTAQLAALTKQVADKDAQLQATKTEMTSLNQRLQQQVDDLKAANTSLVAQIAAKDKLINDQTIALAEKDKLILEKTNLSAQYANGLAIEQAKTVQLTDALNKQTANLAAVTDILEAKKKELDAANVSIASLSGQLEGLRKEWADLKTQYEARIASLEALNAAQKTRIATLEQQQTQLMDQVDVLSSIIDNHVSPADLSEDERARLSKVISDMGPEGSLVQAMLNGPIDFSQLEPYCSLLIGQDFRQVVALYGSSIGLAADVIARFTELTSINDAIYKLVPTGTPATYKNAYDNLATDIKNLATKYLTNLDILLATDNTFKIEACKSLFAQMKSVALVSSLQNWDTAVGLKDVTQKKAADDLKAEMIKVLTSPPETLKTVVVRFRLNAVFEQKQAEMKAQKEASDAAMKILQSQVEDSKQKLADAIRNGEQDMAKAVAEYTGLMNAKDAKIKDQEAMMEKMGEVLFASMSSASDLEMSLMKRMASGAGLEVQSKVIQYYQGKISQLNALIAATKTAVSQGAASLETLQKMTLQLGLLSRNLEYFPYVLPLAVKLDKDGNVIKYSKDVDKDGKVTEVGLEELGTQESIALCWVDKTSGVARYLDAMSISADGQIYASSANRFDANSKLMVVNRGNNLVSFEVVQNDKRFILTLVKTDRVPMLPSNMSDKDKTALAPYMSQIVNYDVKMLPLVVGQKITDEQMFYVEGLEYPVYAEAVILRSHSSADNFKQDMKGFLSIDTNTTPGKFPLVYMPYISDDYHSQPGNKETFFSMIRFDDPASDEKLMLDLLGRLSTYDATVVVDAAKGFTAYDKELEVFLNTFTDKCSKLYNNSYKFENAVLKLTEFASYRANQGSLTTTDFKQFQDSAKKISTMIFSAGGVSNLQNNSAGYKALIGQVDRDGKIVTPGLLNQAAMVTQFAAATDDYLSLSTSNMFLTVGSAMTPEQPCSLVSDNLFSRSVNFKLDKDGSSGFYRLIVTLASGSSYRLAILNAQPMFVPLSVTSALEDKFNLSGALGAVSISNQNGYLKVNIGVDKKPIVVFSSYADPNKKEAGFTFEARVFKKNSFGAKLIEMSGQAKNSITGEDFGQMILNELKRDMTQADQTLSDAAEYLKFAVTEKNRQEFMPYIQSLATSVMNDQNLQKVVKPELVDVLESSLSLFDLNGPMYFVIRDNDGLLLRMGSSYTSDEVVVIEGKSANKIYNDFEFVDSSELQRSSLFRIVPKPNAYGSYLIMAYQPETGTSMYVDTVKNLVLKSTVKDSSDSIVASVVTGSSAESYNNDKSLSSKISESFAISGTMASIRIQSLNTGLGFSNQMGYLTSFKTTSGAKKLVVLDPQTSASYAANTDAALFSIQALSDSDVALILAPIEQLPLTFYNVLLNVNNNKDLDDNKRTALADSIILSFKKMVSTTNKDGQLMLKDFYVNRNLLTLSTDTDKNIYSMSDILGYIKTDIAYQSVRRTGIKFSQSALKNLQDLSSLFNPKSLLEQVLNPENMDLAVYLHTNQDNLAKIRPVWQKLVAFVYGRDVQFVDDTSLNITNFVDITPSASLSAEAKSSLISKLQGMVASNVITKNGLLELLTQLLQKLQPATVATKSAAAAKYEDLVLYDKLELAENMINGRYRDLQGNLVMKRNFDDAQKLIALATDEDIAKMADAVSYKTWKQNLLSQIATSVYALTSDNLNKVLMPGGIELSKYIYDNQADLAKLRSVWEPFVNMIAGKQVTFNNNQDLIIKNFDTAFVVRSDMTDGAKSKLSQPLQNVFNNSSITQNNLRILCNQVLTKLRGSRGLFAGLNIFDMSQPTVATSPVSAPTLVAPQVGGTE